MQDTGYHKVIPESRWDAQGCANGMTGCGDGCDNCEDCETDRASGCDGLNCEGCHGCENIPYVPFGRPVQDILDEVDAFHRAQLDKTWAGWGYSEELRAVLHKDVVVSEEEMDRLLEIDLSGPPQYLRHVKDVKLKVDGDKLPALLQRSDGETLLYSGKLNTLFGEPGTGKSWLALIAANEVILGGGRAVWWDFEDSPDTIARRGENLGALTHLQDKGSFLFVGASLQEPGEFLARQELAAWLGEVPNSFIVIDAAESAGCPSDGGDVVPWYKANIDVWLMAGVGVLLLDHVPKRREDRPKGGIGSQHKLARIDGVALYISGVPWNKQTGGGMKLTVHKDRQGDLPAATGKVAAVIKGVYKDGVLDYSITAPTDDDIPDVADALLDKIAKAGFDGVSGQRNIRTLVKGRGKDIDTALSELISNGLVERVKDGKAYTYYATTAGQDVVEGGTNA